jgi:hypothetical protein
MFLRRNYHTYLQILFRSVVFVRLVTKLAENYLIKEHFSLHILVSWIPSMVFPFPSLVFPALLKQSFVLFRLLGTEGEVPPHPLTFPITTVKASKIILLKFLI